MRVAVTGAQGKIGPVAVAELTANGYEVMVLAALAVAVLVDGFWILFALGEVLWPH